MQKGKEKVANMIKVASLTKKVSSLEIFLLLCHQGL